MALLWIDGFDSYGTSIGSAPAPTGIVGRKYPVGSETNMRIRAGRFTGYSLNINLASVTCYFTKASLTTVDTVVLGFAVYFTALANNIPFVYLMDGSTAGVFLSIQTTGEIKLTWAAGNATSVGAGITAGAWNYIELKVKCNNITGTYELRLNGSVTPILSDSSVDTEFGTNAYHSGFKFLGAAGITLFYIDDLYFLDTSGAANNDFLGNKKVTTLRPDADTATIQWTPDSGSNHYDRVNDNPCNDSTYVTANSSGNIDLYDYTDLTTGDVTGGISGVTVWTIAEITDANAFSLITPYQPGANESDDSGQVVAASLVSYKRLMETDPNTGVAWTVNAVNIGQFGVKVQ